MAPSASPGLCPPLLYQLPALHCPKWALRPRAVSPVLRPTPRCVSRRAPLEISYTSQSDPRTGLVSLGITPWRFARVAAAAGSASLSKAENRPPCGWTVSLHPSARGWSSDYFRLRPLRRAPEALTHTSLLEHLFSSLAGIQPTREWNYGSQGHSTCNFSLFFGHTCAPAATRAAAVTARRPRSSAVAPPAARAQSISQEERLRVRPDPC